MNENRMVIVQIEDPEPLEELEETCQVPGIDMIFFGPGERMRSIRAEFMAGSSRLNNHHSVRVSIQLTRPVRRLTS